MNLKSYVRGIGAGIIVAALIMGVQKGGRQMTEAEIIAEAKNLGMVESSTLIEYNESKVSESETSVVSIPVKESVTSVETTIEASVDSSISNGETEINTDSDTSTAMEENNDIGLENEVEEPDEETSELAEPVTIDPMPDGEAGFVSSGEYVEVKVIRGDSSVSVARRIFEAGLVESAVEFDRYLCQNGYDKSISVGEYQIAYGADFEDIAKTITRRK